MPDLRNRDARLSSDGLLAVRIFKACQLLEGLH
jgi:hypothetical protein